MSTWPAPAFLGTLRHATRWQRVGRLVPLSWILLLIWPLMLLLARRVPGQELAVSLVGIATLVVLWGWFWLHPNAASRYGPSAAGLTGWLAVGSALTFANPYVWHDGVLGFAMVLAGTWPGWRPAVVAIPAVSALILLSMVATGSGIITAFGSALVWLFLGIAIFAVQRLFSANLQLQDARSSSDRNRPVPAEAMNLSPRQVQIMHLVAIGLSDKQIAARLQLSPHTVRTHLQRLYVQHRLHNRAEAAATWIRRQPQLERGPSGVSLKMTTSEIGNGELRP